MVGKFAAVIKKDGSSAQMFSGGSGSWKQRGGLAGVLGGEKLKLVGLQTISIDDNLAITAGSPEANLTFFPDKPGFPAVKITAKGKVEGLRFIVSCDIGIMPDFSADDIMIDAKKIKAPKALIPNDRLFLHMTGNNDAIVAAVCENADRDLEIGFGEEGGKRKIQYTDTYFGDNGAIYAVILDNPNIWYSNTFTLKEWRKGGKLDWKVPFDAKWKGDFSRKDGTVCSRQFVLTSAYFLEWVDQLKKRGDHYEAIMAPAPEKHPRFLSSLVKVPDDVMLAYPLSRSAKTPPEQYCVDDLLRLLNKIACTYILDSDTRSAKDNGIFTCAYNVIVPTTAPSEYSRGNQAIAKCIKDERVFFRHYNDQVLIFIEHIQVRINAYIDFRVDMLKYLEEQEKAHPNLSDFIGRLRTQLTNKMQINSRFQDAMQRATGVDHAIPLLAEMENAIQMDIPTQAKKANDIGSGIKHIGDPQDSRIRADRSMAMNIRAIASIEMAMNPASAEIAKEVRKRTEQVIRGGAQHEKATKW